MLVLYNISMESIFRSISNEGGILSANGQDSRSSHEKATIHRVPFALGGFDLRRFLYTVLGLEIADSLSVTFRFLLRVGFPHGHAEKLSIIAGVFCRH